MTTYYCDLGAGTFVDRDGTDSTTNVLTGPAGLQAAIRGTGAATALAAGDTLYIQGTGDFSRLVMLDCAAVDCTGWGIGDRVQNDDGAGDDWTGIVVQTNIGATDRVLVWLASGKSAANIATADGVDNLDASGDAGDPVEIDPITSVTPMGITIDTNAGDVGTGYIKIIGVNSSWNVDGTRAVMEGNDENRRAFDIKKNRIWLQNIEFTEWGATTTYPAIYINTGGGANAHFINLYIHDSTRCVSCVDGPYASWINCVFSGGDYGVASPASMSCWRYCKFIGCTTAGMNSGDGEQQVIDCLFVGCTTAISQLDDIAIHGCTFVGNPSSASGTGVDINYGGMTVIVGCRFTYLTTGVAITAASSRPTFSYCYFGGNTADLGGDGAAQYDAIAIDGTTTLTLTGSDTDHGYVDPDTADYNLAAGATYRSVALEID